LKPISFALTCFDKYRDSSSSAMFDSVYGHDSK
jgi:hypothetical protein